jgi:hypothetical protein
MDAQGYGFIYKITCIPTGKIYVGQASEFKYKAEKPYKYGITGRWSDHVSSAKRLTGSLYNDITQHGKEKFKVEEICKAYKQDLDALEAEWIEKLKSLVPDGYNVAKHSRNRHHTNSNFADTYKDKTAKAIISYIKQDEKYKLVYVKLIYKDNTVERVVFGQAREITFDEAKLQAESFVKTLGCPVEYDTSYSVIPTERYSSKVGQFTEKKITKIRITTASKLIAVYVTTSEMKSYKEQIRICFGGKGIPVENAYELAKEFIQELQVSENTIEDTILKNSQQAAALRGEASL